ncbi:chymotrypsinogen 2-like [Megalopta genalis]|uniref:chymotrypsinogen 2-like n=1 Tax=Megalopta genalis TaxID=115081 RepID=UPI003FCFDA36
MSPIALILPAIFALANSELEPRIINGTVAKPGQIPYQVSLQTSSNHFCGGSILNADYVITAAHCVVRQVERTTSTYFKLELVAI